LSFDQELYPLTMPRSSGLEAFYCLPYVLPGYALFGLCTVHVENDSLASLLINVNNFESLDSQHNFVFLFLQNHEAWDTMQTTP